MRKITPPRQISRGRWVAGFRVTELPDLASSPDLGSNTFQQRYWAEWQVGLLQGLGRRMPFGAHVQLRFAGHGELDSAVDIEIRCVANNQAVAQGLIGQVLLGLPEMMGTQPLNIHDLHLPPEDQDDTPVMRSVCELRRRRVTIEPEELNLDEDSDIGYTFPWPAGPQALTSVMALLAEQIEPTDFVIDIRPVGQDPVLAAHLRECVELALGEERLNPFRQDVLKVYLERLRDLSAGGFEVRMHVLSTRNLPSGLPDAIGVTLSQMEAYVARQPKNDIEFLSNSARLREFRWDPMPAETDAGDRLVRIWSLREVIRLFHIPLPPSGGFLHLASARVRRLPRSPQAAISGPRIPIGLSLAGTEVALTLDDLNRHVLIAGLPGFGKSTTVRRILSELATSRIPFLVLDPAKDDYAYLVSHLDKIGMDAQFIQLEPGIPAFNPLSVPTGCSSESHVGRLLAAFDSALQISTRWPVGYALLGRAIAQAVGRGDATLETLKEVVKEIVIRDGFSGSVQSEILGSLVGRLEFLTAGPLGVALSARAVSVDWVDLMSKPTVISFRGFGGPTERALLFGLLLANIVSFRESNPISGGLGHVVVLEEAHRVIGLDMASSEGSRLFVEALAELRGSGQGFIVVDQAPTELNPVVAKICGTMISHRIISRSERDAAAASLTLDDRQSEDLAHLERGEIVVHASSGRTPITAQVEPCAAEDEFELPTRRRSLVPPGMLDLEYCIVCRGACRTTPAGARLWRPSEAPTTVSALGVEMRAGNPDLTDEQLVCLLCRLSTPLGSTDYFQMVRTVKQLVASGGVK